MKEEEFEKILEESNFINNQYILNVYWGINEEGNVFIDNDEMLNDFNRLLKELEDLTNIKELNKECLE